MTQPVQEQSTQRNVSGLAWGERQLARRPASGGPGGILPTFRARRLSNSETVPSATDRTIHWDYWEVCNSNFFAARLENAGPFAGQLVEVDLNQTGVYAIHAQIDYEDDLTFQSGIGMFDQINSKMWHMLGDWMEIGNAGPSLTLTVVRFYHATDSARISIESIHNDINGHDVGCDDTNCSNFFQITFLGDYGCDDCDESAFYVGGGYSCADPTSS